MGIPNYTADEDTSVSETYVLQHIMSSSHVLIALLILASLAPVTEGVVCESIGLVWSLSGCSALSRDPWCTTWNNFRFLLRCSFCVGTQLDDVCDPQLFPCCRGTSNLVCSNIKKQCVIGIPQ